MNFAGEERGGGHCLPHELSTENDMDKDIDKHFFFKLCKYFYGILFYITQPRKSDHIYF